MAATALNKNGKGSNRLPGAGLTTGQGQRKQSTRSQRKHKVHHVEPSGDLKSWKRESYYDNSDMSTHAG